MCLTKLGWFANGEGVFMTLRIPCFLYCPFCLFQVRSKLPQARLQRLLYIHQQHLRDCKGF